MELLSVLELCNSLYITHIQRFLTPQHTSPACTTYQDPRTALESTKRLSGLGKAPFGQTSARFRENRQVMLLPGIEYAHVYKIHALGYPICTFLAFPMRLGIPHYLSYALCFIRTWSLQ